MQSSWRNAGVQSPPSEPSLVVNVSGYGAVGDSFTDCRPAFLSAISALAGRPGIIQVPAGKFRLTRGISLPEGAILRGNSSTETSLIFDFGTSGDNGISINGSKSQVTQNLTANAVRGSNTIQLSSTSGLKSGDYLLLTQNNLWETVPATGWAFRSPGQLVQIRYVQGSLVHLAEPLNLTFTTALQAQAQVAVPRQNVGIENIRLRRMANAAGVPSNISFTVASNCWVRGVESHFSASSHIMIAQSSHLTISGNYIHDGFVFDGTGTRGYGVTLIQQSTNCLIENNIFRRLRHGLTCKEGANGNVLAYNYCREPFRTEFPSDGGADCLLHGYWPTANLYEGNVGQFFQASATWGPAGPHNTVFRNRFLNYGIYGSQVATGTNLQQSDSTNIWCNESTATGSFMGFPLGVTMWLSSYSSLALNYAQSALQRSASVPPAAQLSSLYRTSAPEWWPASVAWAKIGWPHAVGSGSNPAYERWIGAGLKVVPHIPSAAAKNITITSFTPVQGSYKSVDVYAGGTLVVLAPLSIDSVLRVRSGASLVLNSALLTGGARLVVDAGGTVVVNGAAGVWQTSAKGAFRLTGAHSISTSSSWVYGSPAAQEAGDLMPATVARLTVNCGSTLTMNKEHTVTDQLVLEAGTLSSTAATRLTLGPNAVIPPVGSAAVWEGSQHSTVLRTWPNELRSMRGSWMFLAPLVANQSIGAWAQSNPFVPTTYRPTGTSSVFLYSQTSPAGRSTNGYIKPDSALQILPVGQGARVWVNPTANQVQLSLLGAPRIGAVTIPLPYCQSGCNFSNPNGWSIVGNPYLSPINWSLVTGKTNVANAIHSWDWRQRRWRTFVNGIGTFGYDGTVQPGEAFMVNATATGASIQFTEGAKTSTAAVPQSIEPAQLVRLKFSTADEECELVLYPYPGATETYSAQTDALKQGTQLAHLQSQDQTQLVIKAYDGVPKTVVSISTAAELVIENLPKLPEGNTWTLTHTTGAVISLQLDDEGNSGSTHVSPGLYTLSAAGATLNPAQATPFPNPFNSQLTISNALGANIKVTDLAGRLWHQGVYEHPFNTEHWPAGLYLLQVGGKVHKMVK